MMRTRIHNIDTNNTNNVQAEYKLKKERWKRDMDSQDTPKSQRNQGDTFFHTICKIQKPASTLDLPIYVN